jgi:hypothetical protein
MFRLWEGSLTRKFLIADAKIFTTYKRVNVSVYGPDTDVQIEKFDHIKGKHGLRSLLH